MDLTMQLDHCHRQSRGLAMEPLQGSVASSRSPPWLSFCRLNPCLHRLPSLLLLPLFLLLLVSSLQLAASSLTKKALFILSNLIFLLLVADHRFYFKICSSSSPTSAVTASEPSGPLIEQAQYHQEEVEEFVTAPHVSFSGDMYPNSIENTNLTGESDEAVKTKTRASEEREEQEVMSMSSSPEPELGRLRLDEEDDFTLEVVVMEVPTCEELEKLEIDELNRKFDEFIQSRRKKWKAEALAELQLQIALV